MQSDELRDELWSEDGCLHVEAIYQSYLEDELPAGLAGRAFGHQRQCPDCQTSWNDLLATRFLRPLILVEFHLDVPRAHPLYLGGELDDDQCLDIDRHLLSCHSCESNWDARSEAYDDTLPFEIRDLDEDDMPDENN